MRVSPRTPAHVVPVRAGELSNSWGELLAFSKTADSVAYVEPQSLTAERHLFVARIERLTHPNFSGVSRNCTTRREPPPREHGRIQGGSCLFRAPLRLERMN